MPLKRRAFLQRVCWTLAGLGLSETGLAQLGDRYHQVLAQPTTRKLALLVGINQYARAPGLNGCLTDVELQRELLIHRFRFQPSDILILTDQKATRSNIEAAFMAHLVEQARPADVVVFHFSGYGRRLHLGGGRSAEPTSGVFNEQNALVPVDGILSTSATSEGAGINNLLDDTLFLLLRSLQTDQVTTILDTSYTYPGSALMGNLRVRARPAADLAQLVTAEQAFQAELLQQAGISQDQVRVQRQSSQMPGVVLAAAKPLQMAAEAQWHGFNAGLFTYALTQQLWNSTPATTLSVSLTQVATTVEQRVGKDQQPSFGGQKSPQTLLPAYDFAAGTAADGVVLSVEEKGKSSKLWLSGLPPEVLEMYSPNAVLTVVSPPQVPAPPSALPAPTTATESPLVPSPAPLPSPVADSVGNLNGTAEPEVPAPPAPNSPRSLATPPQIQLQSTHGLVVKGQLLGQGMLQPGQLVQEAIRVLPRDIGLAVALDSCLERIERVDATSAFSTLSHISPVVAGEQPADCLFAKILTNSSLQAKSSEASAPWHALVGEANQSQCSYGLFSIGKELLPNTLGDAGEAIKAAVRRLNPKLQVLLSAKLLGLTVNPGSSRLGVSATLEMVTPEPQVLIHQETSRAPWSAPTPVPLAKSNPAGGIVTIPIGSRIQYRINNYSDRPIYLALLGVDSSASAFLYTTTPSAASPETRPAIKQEVIAPSSALTLPHLSNTFEWVVHGPTGLVTTYLIVSSQPLNRTLRAIETLIHQGKTTEAQQIIPLTNPLEIVQEILQDLQQASEAAATAAGISNEWFAFDVNHWATFPFIYRTI